MEIDQAETLPSPAAVALSRRMRAKFLDEVARAQLPKESEPPALVTQSDLAELPATVQRYFHFMKVVGRPRVWSFCAHFTGVFRMRPTRPWMPCECWQYNSCLGITRIFHMRLKLGGVVPVYVRDTYMHGQGRMLGRVFDTVRIVDEVGDKIDTGELVTYLNDAILFAPSMLLGKETVWSAVDDRSFDIALSDGGRRVQARVRIDERGAVEDFSTTDRYGTDPWGSKEMVRARWSTPVRGWAVVNGRRQPTGGEAIWHFPSGDFAYADFGFSRDAIEFNVAPDQK